MTDIPKDDSLTPHTPITEAGRLLVHTFGVVPKYRKPLAIDTPAVLSHRPDQAGDERVKTRKRVVQVVFADVPPKVLPPQQEYTFYDESVFICTHTFENGKGAKAIQVYVWEGKSALETMIETANTIATRISREHGSAPIQNIRQGHESATFLQALGGIFVTRRGAAEGASKQFMLRGQKHSGHIVFDEVDFSFESLCNGFAYVISHPVTLVERQLYVWKGLACATEEHSAAKMAAMDMSENGEFIPVDDGAEDALFLKMFGFSTQNSSVPKPSGLWLQKMAAPSKFCPRLLSVQQAPQRTGLMTALWNRRPSWNNLSSARSSPTVEETKVEVKEITPIMQSSLVAEGLYVLDGFGELYLLIGPLFSAHPEPIRDALLGQALLFTSNYAIIAASTEDRPAIPKTWCLFSGVPRDVKMLFRHWEESRRLWGTAELMSGNANGREVNALALADVLDEVCRD